jgi:hypothetical protein
MVQKKGPTSFYCVDVSDDEGTGPDRLFGVEILFDHRVPLTETLD